MSRHSQKGSALLIVLGFLSFMVVSAVAFAVWMRNERLPSSALRRNVANRYLVKAALAQAMSRVDDAIRSHAFPGAWNTNLQNTVYRDQNGWAYDWWESRVFMPPNPEGMVDDRDNAVKPSTDPHFRYAPVTKTVSVLNLEALGYLPPGIVNDVRLLSRSSWAAQWDYFNFDAGRYAFCAVNVSDMLDITKLAADNPRTSGAAVHSQGTSQKPPSSRFALAYLFRGSGDNADFSNPDARMKEFDDCVHVKRPDWEQAPLVSLLDYNLSVGSGGGNLQAPFYEYIVPGGTAGKFFYGGALGSPFVKWAERQPFVTASWFPPSNVVKSDGTPNTPLDISQHQPYMPGFGLRLSESQNQNFDTILLDASNQDRSKEFWDAIVTDPNNSDLGGHALCALDRFTLYDYLDENDVPLSLAMPCTERVPMITALAPVGDVTVNFTPMTMLATGNPEIDETKREWRETSEANITLSFSGMGMQSVILYPFKDAGTPKNCSIQAFARLVFVGEAAAGGGGAGGGGGAAVASVTLRNNGFAKNFRPLKDAEWTTAVDESNQFKLDADAGPGGLSRTAAPDSLVVTFAAKDMPYAPQANIQDVANCFNECWTSGKLLQMQDIVQLQPKPFLRKVDVYELEYEQVGDERKPKRGTTLKGTYYQVLLNPFDNNGNVLNVMGLYQNPTGLGISKPDFDDLCQKYTISPYLLTWVRVVQNGKTVDMVPATYEDDLALNGIDNMEPGLNMPAVNYALGNTPSNLSGKHPLPIMRFPGTMSFTYENANTGTDPPVNPNQWTHKSCYAVDPRFNWAPENWWFDDDNSSPTGQRWYQTVFDRDPDGTLDKAVVEKLVEYEFGSGYERADRANDPFMFVSNLGYLQSVGELAFLPHISNMRENGVPMSVLGDRKEDEDNDPFGNLYNGEPRKLSDFLTTSSSTKTMPCALAAWKTYQNYRTNPKIQNTLEFGANLYRRGLVNGSQGFYINPYTQSQEVLLAALANTPLNYWVAGTNDNTTIKTRMDSFSSYKNYTFSESGIGAARMTGKDLTKIATFLRHRFEDLASMIDFPQSMDEQDLFVYQRVWEDMFDALDWSGNLENYTVEHVYDRLEQYYSKGEANTKNYRLAYSRGSMNHYSDLNHFARGGGKKLLDTGITLKKELAVHKDDFGLSADPLRGQHSGDRGDTACWDALHDVDRKFLHSYWRDCFANRQQLFLIFVRAEATALGGAGEGTPAQQGGRAVALVWRDPEPPTDGNVNEDEGMAGSNPNTKDGTKYGQNGLYSDRHPHRMRILFYRQLD